jgi:hypothetical protein
MSVKRGVREIISLVVGVFVADGDAETSRWTESELQDIRRALDWLYQRT